MLSGLRNRAARLLQRPGSADLKHYLALLPDIAGREQAVMALTDSELTAAAGEAADDAAFCALAREAARRGLGERPFDVQLVGTLALLAGQVAEMATGEGKTLSGALAAAGYALLGQSVHVMSVNDYLARRDAEWMRPVYDLLGVSVGWIAETSTPAERRHAYAAQVTYGSVSEFGFDVLRDRLATSEPGLIAGAPDVVLIDEADSVLVDEALVPLILAGAADDPDAGPDMVDMARRLRAGRDYLVDEEGRSVHLTDKGTRVVEEALGGIDLYTDPHLGTLTRVNVALYAQALLQRDVDYIVRDGKVELVSASRGRVAQLQRWPDGLHAAVEAKEGLGVSQSGEILDSITIQSLIGRYPRKCGMTGTAVAVGEQLREFYELEIAVIPPNRPCVRTDEPDRLYATTVEKEQALATHVAQVHATGRPVLIGTLDVAESERIAEQLGRAGVSSVVLNAKNDAEEAAIVAEAGTRGTVTVSTQMAGRGTDIRLGGAAGDDGEIAALGGLHVIGTGRHVSSRLDNQLRGRAGRQGDPGSSVFFVSLQDELVIQHVPDASPAEAPDADGRTLDARALETVAHAQRIAEGVSLELHRNTWRYNQLINIQRDAVLDQRDRVLRTDAALSALARQCPDRFAALSEIASEEVLADAARQITLWHLDRAWTDHLGFLADVREGIHLRALGRGLNPLDEFHKESLREFNGLLERVEERSVETFETIPVTADGADLGAAGLKRPTATWTYLVQDNPFGTDVDRAMRSVGRALRKLLPS
ncbi:MAG TPA: accessory Sec system translocase SecA2 [Streptosporangiaceae bacterium]|nr:accessory Sec system translocase SecA2 [Streptosporangiaceae bacterium]